MKPAEHRQTGLFPRPMLAWGVAAMAALPAVPAHANVFDDVQSEVSRTLDYVMPDAWQDESDRLTIGAGALVVPDYEGSDDYKVQPLPLVDLRLGNLVFLQTNQIKVVATQRPVRMGAIAKLDLGRSETGNPALSGLDGVGTSLEAGGFAEGRVDNWVMQMELRQDILGGHNGVIATVAAGRIQEFGEKWRLISGLQLNWSSGDYMDSFFGISPREAVASEHPTHDPSSGFKDIGVRFIGAYQASSRVSIEGGVGYQRLLGGARKSPIVKDSGSANQITVGLTVRYRIWRQEE